MSEFWLPSRRAFVAGLAALPAAACGDLVDEGNRAGPKGSAPVAARSGPGTIGTGIIKVALILPLTASGQGAVAAASLRNAAELAVSEFEGGTISILVKDDRGTADGAREAAIEATGEGAELIIGPLFAPAVTAAATVARSSGRPIIAFSTDVGVAARGVYLLSFLPQVEVDRVVDYAASAGKRSLAALVPDTTYGSVVEGAVQEAAARRGMRIVALERYPAGGVGQAVARLAPAIAGSALSADTLFVPASGTELAGIGAALEGIKFSPARVKPLGTGLWNDPRALSVAAVQGGWFAAPDSAGFNAFAGRYRARFGSEPSRIATLSYDAVSLVAAVARTQGSQRFTDSVLQNPAGFAGADGVFRFRSDGTSERALAVLEVRGGASASVSPAPKVLPPSAA